MPGISKGKNREKTVNKSALNREELYVTLLHSVSNGDVDGFQKAWCDLVPTHMRRYDSSSVSPSRDTCIYVLITIHIENIEVYTQLQLSLSLSLSF